ncbi:hypothetical protein E2320_014077 [Naja naja]|nr:hypothetical protein E2320_014077 [Naja naja]
MGSLAASLLSLSGASIASLLLLPSPPASGFPASEDSSPLFCHGQLPGHTVLLQPHANSRFRGLASRGSLPKPCRSERPFRICCLCWGNKEPTTAVKNFPN